MEHFQGLLRVHVHKGVNLAVRDVRTSDPYVVIQMGKHVLLSLRSLYYFTFCALISMIRR